MTKAIEKRIPALGKGNRTVHLKLFDPCGRYTYYATEYDPEDRLLYGFCVSPLGAECSEWGYASLAEIESAKGPFGLGIERDMYFEPADIGEALRRDSWAWELDQVGEAV